MLIGFRVWGYIVFRGFSFKLNNRTGEHVRGQNDAGKLCSNSTATKR